MNGNTHGVTSLADSPLPAAVTRNRWSYKHASTGYLNRTVIRRTFYEYAYLSFGQSGTFPRGPMRTGP